MNTASRQDRQTGRGSPAFAPATGKHDLYLVFKGGDGYLFNLMSWKLIFPASSEERVAGDVNADGMFDVLDLVLLQKWLLAIPDVTLDAPDAGDMDRNESLDIFDLGLT